MSLQKVISGGQNGVDVAALKVAKLAGIPTGGWIPKGWKTLDGPRPEYGKTYFMRQAPSSDYPTRTRMNVEDSCCTIQLFLPEYAGSPGEACTRRCIREVRRPSYEIPLTGRPISPDDLAAVLIAWDVKILNVAGNSEHTAPGVELLAIRYLMQLFPLLL
jgi:hypothetical protein